MPVQNEPIYNGVSLGKLIDKPIYATGNVIGVDSTNKTKYNFKNGDFIGSLFSWATLNSNTYLMFYKTQNDYDNFNPFFVKISSSTTSPSLTQIKEEIKKQEQEAANAGKSMLQIYIEKYAPYVIGAVVISIALPSIANSVRSKKMGAMSKNKGLAIAGGAALLLLAFRNPKRKTSIIISPYEDITDWNNTEASAPRIIEPVVPYLYQKISGISKEKKSNIYTC